MGVFEAPKKEGRDIGIKIIQVDENGFKVSKTDAEWYGFTNSEANDKTMELIKSGFRLVDGWKEAKKERSGQDTRERDRPGR